MRYFKFIIENICLLSALLTVACQKPYEDAKAVKPVIIEQPQSATYNEYDEIVPLYVTAESADGGELSYQWYEDDASNWKLIPGATQTAYTPPASYGNTNRYICRIRYGDYYSIDSEVASITFINSTPFDGLSDFDRLLINGMTASLEQIYLMTGDGSTTIPIYDKPAAELFENENSIVDLIYQTQKYRNDYIMRGLYKGEIWTFAFYESEPDTVRWEVGYGSTYMVQERVSRDYYEIIESDNLYSPRLFCAPWRPNSPYHYRGHDNIGFGIRSYDDEDEWALTNLNLVVLTKEGNALFEKGYFYLDTNPHYELAYRYTPPLTGAQAAQIIQNGTEGVDYEIYLYNGLTVYKIGENLYIPTIGNTYKYIGSSNQNGMLSYYEGKYYRLKFKILSAVSSVRYRR
ncbi:MAG: hypothetical protein LBL13_05900 [Bacteroidales bacterium]|jgi:hypothetical protein|nr:hypothetical protein [Bacteroidales bacterium]